jgi:protein arginine kinase activator
VKPCQECQERDAVIHLTRVDGAQTTTMHLCSRCAAERGIESKPTEMPFKSPLGDFLAAMAESNRPLADTTPATRCPQCGATLRDISRQGRLGCATCWETFASEMKKLVRRLHGSNQYVGTGYSNPATEDTDASDRHREARERIRLKTALREAVAQEAFEVAAQLRDALHDLPDVEQK